MGKMFRWQIKNQWKELKFLKGLASEGFCRNSEGGRREVDKAYLLLQAPRSDSGVSRKHVHGMYLSRTQPIIKILELTLVLLQILFCDAC